MTKLTEVKNPYRNSCSVCAERDNALTFDQKLEQDKKKRLAEIRSTNIKSTYAVLAIVLLPCILSIILAAVSSFVTMPIIIASAFSIILLSAGNWFIISNWMKWL